MRVVFLIRGLDRGGAERQLLLLAIGLKRAGHYVSVYVFYGGGDFEAELRENGIPVRVLDKAGRWHTFGFLLRAATELRAERADVIHSYMSGANIAAAVLKPWLRPAKLIWGIRASRLLFTGYGWVHRIGARLEVAFSKKADLIIVNSEAGRNHLLDQGFPRQKTVFIPNGLDAQSFFIDLDARQRMRDQWGVKDGEVLVGRVGRLDPLKDYPGFLRAAAAARILDPRLKFVCIGAGTTAYLEYLRSYAVELGLDDLVLWTGAVQEMRAAYNALDLLASTSVSEGFPNVLLESMACGVPCVTTDVGDAQQIVLGSGLTVPVGESEALANALISILKNPPKPEVVRDSIISRYGTDFLVRRTEEHLVRLVSTTQKQKPCAV